MGDWNTTGIATHVKDPFQMAAGVAQNLLQIEFLPSLLSMFNVFCRWCTAFDQWSWTIRLYSSCW